MTKKPKPPPVEWLCPRCAQLNDPDHNPRFCHFCSLDRTKLADLYVEMAAD